MKLTKTPEKNIKNLQLKLQIVNALIKKAEPHYINYCKALKEIWKEKIDKKRDYDILASYGLGYNGGLEFPKTKKGRIGKFKFYWSWEITELAKRCRQCLK